MIFILYGLFMRWLEFTDCLWRWWMRVQVEAADYLAMKLYQGGCAV